MGEAEVCDFADATSCVVDTLGGRVHVQWDAQQPMTAMGQLPFFIDFLRAAGLYERWVQAAPLRYDSPNAPSRRDVLGTLFLSVLAGHWRYAHISALRCDNVSPPLLGMSKIVSEDSVRRCFGSAHEQELTGWLRGNLADCWGPLLTEPWILDMDTTIKTIYGKQEGAELGYNPHKKKRPSHVYHTFLMARLRLVLDADVCPGNRMNAGHGSDQLWRLIDELPQQSRPALLRGDNAWGNEQIMSAAEQRGLPYLFKLRQMRGVSRLIDTVFSAAQWSDAGQGWEGCQSQLQLIGWTKARRVVVLRRQVRGDVLSQPRQGRSKQKDFLEADSGVTRYEFAVLVTTLELETAVIAQLYRDRADAENAFDELKNQWGWGGYMTRDLKRCRAMARIVALIYNWWSLYVRLASPDNHREAITSRPLLLYAVARKVQHAGQSIIKLQSTHAKATQIRAHLTALSAYLRSLMANAEQLEWSQRWRIMLSKIFEKLLDGKPLREPQTAIHYG